MKPLKVGGNGRTLDSFSDLVFPRSSPVLRPSCDSPAGRNPGFRIIRE